MHWKKDLPKNPYCKTMVWYSVQCVSQEVIDGYHIFLEWTSSLYGNFLVWLINKPWYVNSDICLESQIMSVILCKAWDVFFGYFVMEKKTLLQVIIDNSYSSHCHGRFYLLLKIWLFILISLIAIFYFSCSVIIQNSEKTVLWVCHTVGIK